jgi:phosphate transport system substrate-binding protein
MRLAGSLANKSSQQPSEGTPMMRRSNRNYCPSSILGIAILAIGSAFISQSPVFAADIVLNETGSTLLYPLFKLWIPAYALIEPGVTLTAASTGSGEGLKQAIAGTAQIGTSDAYMSDEDAQHNPQIVNIPLAISALTINYNIPDLNGAGLKLDGPVLAGIYSGTIRQWNAAPIAALNPGVALPQHEIIPVRRADSSGDTFVFTQFLDFSTQKWEDTVGYGTTVAWPTVPGALSGTGNAGVVQTITATPYSVAYVGISFAIIALIVVIRGIEALGQERLNMDVAAFAAWRAGVALLDGVGAHPGPNAR